MGITLSIFWFLVCTGVIFFYKKFNTFGIKKPVLAGIFLFKVLLGWLYLYIHTRYYGGGDTIMSFYKSEIVYHTFFTHPLVFFKLLIVHPKPVPTELIAYADQIGVYTDNSTYFMIRLQTLLRFISGGHFTVHIVLYNFFTFWGILYLYGFCKGLLNRPSWLLLIVVFFMPSAAFWASGFHKDGIELCGIALLLYSIQRIVAKQYNIADVVRGLLGAFLIYEARVYILLIISVCLLAYILSSWAKRYSTVVFAGVILLVFTLSILSVYLDKDHNILYIMYYWQGMFMYINHSNSTLLLPVLEPTFNGLVRVLPVAFENVFLHPNILELFNSFLKADFMINMLHGALLLCGVYCLVTIPKNKKTVLGMLLLISIGFMSAQFYGIIVGNLGALSRYRSVPMLLLWLGYSIPIATRLMDKNITRKLNTFLFESMHPIAPKL